MATSDTSAPNTAPSGPRPQQRQRRGRPNILWICSDQQRWDTLGCNGNRFVRTPNIDALAQAGINCSQAFCQNPLCTPSRGSFLTGRYPSTNRLRQNGQLCPPDLRILPRMLADQGYTNGLIGKLHLNPCNLRFTLGERWWEVDPRCNFPAIEQRIDDGYHEFYWDHSASANFTSSDYQRWVHERGSQISNPPRADSQIVLQGMPDALHQTRWAADRAISFMERHGKDANDPWMLSVNIFDPHPDFDPEPDYFARYLPFLDEIPLPAVVPGENTGKPNHHRSPHKPESMSDREKRMMIAAYWAMCDHIDHHVGRMLKALEASGQRDNTVVIYTSDHGELLGDHDKLPKGPFLYDCSLHVPLIIHWPGHWEGRRLDGLVELTDITPSLASVCDLPQADRRSMQGWDLGPWLRGEQTGDTVRADVFAEYPNSQPHAKDAQVFQTMIRTATHKLIRVHSSDDGELYDLNVDPGEHQNRWHDPAYLAVKVELLARLSDRQARTCDPQPERIGIF